jgi:hypothetical protein
MLYRNTSWFMAGIMALALGVGLCPAQILAQNQARAVNQALTPDDLGKLLTDMGYEPKKIDDNTYEVIIKRDGWAVYLRCCFSSDKTKLWLISSLGDIKDINQAPADVLANLLIANFNHGPSAFYLEDADANNKAAKRLKIGRPVDNRAITASILRQQIDAIFSTIRETKDLWKTSEWKSTKAAVAPATGGEPRIK